MKASERMNLVLDYLSIKAVALANRTNLGQTRIRDIIRNDARTIPADVAEAICVKFPIISKDWLLYEDGDMLTNQNQTDTNIKFIETQQDATLELLRQEQVLMREELAMMRQELTLMRQLLSRDQYAIGIASEQLNK